MRRRKYDSGLVVNTYEPRSERYDAVYSHMYGYRHGLG